MEHVEVDGLRICYERAGSGPAVFLLHGYVGDGPATWRRQIDALSDAFTVVAWDAPGTGGSSDPPESLGMGGYADCLARFVEALGLDGGHVVGLSFGGALALELHRRHPDLPATLVLVSAYAGWYGSLPAEVADGRLAQAIELADLPGDDFVAALLPTMFAAETPRETVKAFGACMKDFHPTGFRAMARASAENLRAALPGVRVPTLLVYGADDVRAPRAVAEDLEAAIAGSELVVLEKAGHLCNIDAPDEFNRVVRRFLEGHRDD